jgi:hypothetical protein
MRLVIVLSSLSAVLALGCGGGTHVGDDAGTHPGDDAFVPTNDAFVPTDDAFVPTDDAFVPADDAFVPADDTGGSGGACTNTSDEAVTSGSTFSDDLGNCAMSHFAEPGLMNCIVGLGLSSPCAGCFDTEVHCTANHCALQCAGGDSPQCTMCRATNCDPAFSMCAGFTP